MTIPSDLHVVVTLGSRRLELSGADFNRQGFRVVGGFLQALVGGERGTIGREGLSLSPNANASEKRVYHKRSGVKEGVQGEPSGGSDAVDVDNFASYLAHALDDEKSMPFIRRVVVALPREVVLDAFHRARDATAIRRSRAALFTSILRPHLKLHPRPCPRDSTPGANHA